jgi:hypothetical protein
MRMLAGLVMVAVVWGQPAESRGLKITRTDLGKDWPLTVESGVLKCSGSGRTGGVTFESGGVKYNVNGLASTWKLGLEIDSIWAIGEPLWVTDPKTKKPVNVGPQ